MKRMQRGWILTVGLLLTGSACRYSALGDFTGLRAAESAVSLNVVNEYDFPLKIYAVGSGITQRLGTVYPGLDGNMLLPPAMVGNGSVELIAPAGDGRPVIRSGPLLLFPGNAVDFKVSRYLGLSNATVRP